MQGRDRPVFGQQRRHHQRKKLHTIQFERSELPRASGGMASQDQINSGNKDIGELVAHEKEEDSSEEYVIIPPDGGYGWIITAASFLCVLISDGILFSFGLILSELERVYNEPVAKVAWIFSIVNGISLISGLAT